MELCNFCNEYDLLNSMAEDMKGKCSKHQDAETYLSIVSMSKIHLLFNHECTCEKRKDIDIHKEAIQVRDDLFELVSKA